MLLKIPLTLPYPVNEGVYEKINVDFEHDDIFYKGIKQKLDRDTLYILCYKDQQEKRLAKSLADYEKVSNDLSSKSKQSQDLLIKILKEYEGFNRIEAIEQSGWSMNLSYAESSVNLIAFERSVQVPPPKTLKPNPIYSALLDLPPKPSINPQPATFW